MPIYVYWGEDDFAMQTAIFRLRDRFVDSQWLSFNYTVIPATQPDAVIQGLTQAITPPFGAGHRLTWLVDTTVFQQCSTDLLAELQRTLPAIPENSVLLLSCRNKPDGRLKSTQLVQKFAQIQEFSLIPPWKTEQLIDKVQQAARELNIKLTLQSAQMLAEAVGNDTRQMYNELEKLRIFASFDSKPIDKAAVAALVSNNTHNSLHLAAAIKDGDSAKALELITQLIEQNEPALRIVATLIGQFRMWLWVKLMSETRQDNAAIAQAAEIANPKRVYFLQQDVKGVSVKQLASTLPVLLELEVSLKQGIEEILVLQTKIMELCQLFC
ncbi:DNA polymerase III subunit delta [Chroogloeocystis siderophila]|jgi:DNA polymerase-3 subunit delta|uniref:DNA polymerase III subunit delta n=1 Tax=Chroogloeocystis siderophila 5.2 s.c.1 TaxID=247279 RepID=A0A1U7HWD2_9CHRO|nr:DNA polymerase III subunit delta [Chroogloeocystis siderophila]OKH27852.1 DNA polymerase III subunit delta [Chroogloeocystis siderophila 5.2 s.c.1]